MTAEYRVSYRRSDWCSTQSQSFPSLPLALRLVTELMGRDREGLAPVLFINLETRGASGWRSIDRHRPSRDEDLHARGPR